MVSSQKPKKSALIPFGFNTALEFYGIVLFFFFLSRSLTRTIFRNMGQLAASYSYSRLGSWCDSGGSRYTHNFLDVSTIRGSSISKTINDIRSSNRILEDLPLWRGEWFNDGGSASPAKPADPKKNTNGEPFRGLQFDG